MAILPFSYPAPGYPSGITRALILLTGMERTDGHKGMADRHQPEHLISVTKGWTKLAGKITTRFGYNVTVQFVPRSSYRIGLLIPYIERLPVHLSGLLPHHNVTWRQRVVCSCDCSIDLKNRIPCHAVINMDHLRSSFRLA